MALIDRRRFSFFLWLGLLLTLTWTIIVAGYIARADRLGRAGWAHSR